MSQKQRMWGSITILSGLGGTLTAALIIWIFGQALHIEPLVRTLGNLSSVIEKLDRQNSTQYNEIMRVLNAQEIRMSKNEVKLNRALQDCIQNATEIRRWKIIK